jgi:hypothetical protein
MFGTIAMFVADDDLCVGHPIVSLVDFLLVLALVE